MEKNERGKLQLPGRKFDLSDSVRNGNSQFSQEKAAITDLFFRKTGYYFWISAIAGMYNFTQKGRLIKAFLLQLSDQYEKDISLTEQSKNLLFITADEESIRKSRRILPDDKIILLDFLSKKDSIKESFDPPNIVSIQAIAS